MCARAFEAGWAGAAFKTICNFPIHEASPRFSAINGSDGSIIGFKNIEQLSDHSVPENMSIFRQLKKNYPTKFILASIMGQNEHEWGELAHTCQENGADAIELNFSCPNMMEDGLGSDIGQIPELVERFTAAAKKSCTIPVLAKLTPNVGTMSPASAFRRRLPASHHRCHAIRLSHHRRFKSGTQLLPSRKRLCLCKRPHRHCAPLRQRHHRCTGTGQHSFPQI